MAKAKKKKTKRKTKKTGEGPGRPTKKTPEIVEILMQCLKEGLHVETACAYAKINKQTFYNWLKEDENFSTQIEFAKSEAIRMLSMSVRNDDPWKILKNLAPKLYRDKIDHGLEGSDGGPIKLIVEDYREE